MFRARDALREQRSPPSEPVRVNVLPGTYFLNETFTLGPEDSGTSIAPITYAGTGSGFSILSAGVEVSIPGSGQNLVAGQSERAPSGVVSIPLADSVGCGVTLRQVWGTDGTRRSITSTGVIQYSKFDGTTITPKPGTLPSWHNASSALASADALIFHSWTAALVAVKGPGSDGSSVVLAHKDGDHVYSASLNRYTLQNVVDPASMKAGQFAHDAGSCSLVYAPMEGETTIVLPKVHVALELLGNTSTASPGSREQGAPAFVEYVNFEGLNFTHTTGSVHGCRSTGTCDGQSFASERQSAVMLEVAKHVNFSRVAVAHTGNYGMTIGSGSSSVSVTRSHFFDLGVGGVRIGEPAHGAAPSGSDWEVANLVELADSVIEDGGHVIMMGCGVLLEQAHDNVVTHNTIRNMLYSGVSVGWDWTYEATSNRNNVVSYNDIYDIMQGQLSDGGCVYHLGRSPGTLIDHNVCSGVNSAGYGG